MTSSVTIDRTSLALSPLVIPLGLPTAGFWIAEGGIERPVFEWVIERVASRYEHGATKVSARKDMSVLPFTVYAQAATSVELAVLETELETALAQWSFDVTLTIDDVARTFAADLSAPSWGAVDSGMVDAHLSRAAVAIPVNQGA